MSRSVSHSARAEQETDAPRLEQRPEFNKYGEYTGEDYYVCTGCGADAMWPDAVDTHCTCGRVA